MESVKPLLREVRQNPMLRLLVFVPLVIGVEHFEPEAHQAVRSQSSSATSDALSGGIAGAHQAASRQAYR
jgi:hypothetical protein